MEFNVSLPEWAVAELATLPTHMETLAERMTPVVRFSQLNIEHDTGGPFAAAVYERDTGRLVAIGVNRVVPSHCSSAHAEVVTLSLAQKLLGTFDLGGMGMPAFQLVVNARPCAMCYGAVVWSGVRSLVVAGSGEEVETITGFDEGPIHPDWRGELERRGIEVIEGVMREEAVAVFHNFAKSDRLVYNGRGG